jgi:hypothetical protein
MTAEFDEVLEDARNLGRLAYKSQGRPSENPYQTAEPALCKAWAEGFREAYLKDGHRGQPV